MRWFSLFFLVVFSSQVWSELVPVAENVIVDSEESFERRLYSYDFDVTPDGRIHVIYAKPVSGADRTEIIYMSRLSGQSWPPEAARTVLEISGLFSSISTRIITDANNNAHVSYLVRRSFVDSNGTTHAEGLVYQKISAGGKVGAKVNVSPGGFHTLMQLDEQSSPMFVREYEDFLDASGALRAQPFPKALRLQLPLANNRWTDREHILDLPAAEDYRLANFVYDAVRGRYHVAYGNKDADALRASYPTTNPPAEGKSPVYFPPGSGHQLVYAGSSDLNKWTTSFIDASGNLSENEFWSDLGVDSSGNPFAAAYRYKTDAIGIQQGSSSIFARLQSSSWNQKTVAGHTTGASEHRAGMGAKVQQDLQGGFHGVWDNSPDAPIDSESLAGTTMYRYSPDGNNWETRQVLFPFSTEGKIRTKIHNDRLYVMLLGDATNARLIFAEYKLPVPGASVVETGSDKMFYGNSENIRLHIRLQGDGSQPSDIYIITAGPFDKLADGTFQANGNTKIRYLGGDFAWHTLTDVFQSQPLVRNFGPVDFSASFMNIAANSQMPFEHPARYLILSLATKTGTALRELKLNSAPYVYEFHACNELNCGEFASK